MNGRPGKVVGGVSVVGGGSIVVAVGVVVGYSCCSSGGVNGIVKACLKFERGV